MGTGVLPCVVTKWVDRISDTIIEITSPALRLHFLVGHWVKKEGTKRLSL